MNGNFKDLRLIEAFDYIDPKYIAEVGESLKLRSVYAKEYVKPTFGKQVKQIALLVGCLLLLSCAFPVVNYAVRVISSFAAGWGSETTENLYETEIPENTEFPDNTEYIYGDYLKPIKDLEPLPVGIFDNIKEKYKYASFDLQYTNVSCFDSDRYLGCFNGYYVFLNTMAGGGGAFAMAQMYNIDGYTFYERHTFQLCTYKNRELANLSEVYSSGMISQEQLQTIYLRNNEYMRYFDPDIKVIDLLPISESDFKELNSSWATQYGNGKNLAESIEDIRIKNYSSTECPEYFNGGLKIDCYGKNDSCIFFVTERMDSEVKDTVQNIAGYEFRVGFDEAKFWVLCDKKIYTLQEAYDLGIVSSYTVGGIAFCYEMGKAMITFE